VRILTPMVVTRFEFGQVVPMEEYKSEIRRLKEEDPDLKGVDEDKIIPTTAPTPAFGTEQYTTLTLLPNLRYTMALLILPLLALWVAWRTVNLPAFADFQIATEAEMNKVSWTTKKRLYQDTIVVLITVFMMAVYLFAIDQIWSQLLSWKQVGVIVFKHEDSATNKRAEDKPY
jgi:preprotein translocase SecE subunit